MSSIVFSIVSEIRFLRNSLISERTLVDSLEKRVNALAKKMNFNHKINVKLSERRQSYAQIYDPTTGWFNIALDKNKVMRFGQGSIDFTICHEIAHLKRTSKLGLGMTLSLFLSFVPKLFYPSFFLMPAFLQVVVTVSLIATFFLIAYINLGVKLNEKIADLAAADALGSARGGIFSFQKLLEHNKQYYDAIMKNGTEEEKISLEKKVTPEGNALNSTHPVLTERIRYLKEWERNHVRNS